MVARIVATRILCKLAVKKWLLLWTAGQRVGFTISTQNRSLLMLFILVSSNLSPKMLLQTSELPKIGSPNVTDEDYNVACQKSG